MAYIGKSPSGTGVRTRFYFTQSSGGGTSISGTDDNGKTLTYTDGEYVDVYLNGVLLVHRHGLRHRHCEHHQQSLPH